MRNVSNPLSYLRWRMLYPLLGAKSQKNSVEINYLRTFGDTSVGTSLHERGIGALSVTTPLRDKSAWELELRHDARKDNFTWSLNAGGRISDHQKDLRIGTTLTWDL